MGPRIREDKEGKGDKISRLRCAVLGMICVRWGKRMGMDSRRGGNNGGRDGSPHARGEREGAPLKGEGKEREG